MSKVALECEQCGKEFELWPSQIERGEGKYCSRECQYKGHEKVERTCKWCGNIFKIFPSEIDKNNDNFCSTECHNKYQKRNKIQRVCENCGETFETAPSSNKDKFCSQECYLEYNKKEIIEIVCENCGKPIKRDKRLVDRTENNFCSRECMWEYNEINIENHKYFYSSIWWKKRREKILERDNYKCQTCGMTNQENKNKYGNSLEIHHKKPLRKFDDKKEGSKKENLITLCSSCHRSIEGD